MAESPRQPDVYANSILAQFAAQKTDGFIRHLQPVELSVKQIIYHPNEPIRHAYFPEAGMISVVSIMQDGRSIEVGTIGREGMAGARLLAGSDSGPYQNFVQLPGHGYRVDASALKSEAAQNETLRNLVLRYQTAFLTQSMQGAACNGLHSVTQRCCRWLLMSQDRAQSDSVPLTHEFLAQMLGVRRASVTEVLGPLQERGWILSNRGEIVVRNRKGLESGSCECYRIIKDQEQQFLN